MYNNISGKLSETSDHLRKRLGPRTSYQLRTRSEVFGNIRNSSTSDIFGLTLEIPWIDLSKYIVRPAFKKCILWIKFTFLLSGETVVLQ